MTGGRACSTAECTALTDETGAQLSLAECAYIVLAAAGACPDPCLFPAKAVEDSLAALGNPITIISVPHTRIGPVTQKGKKRGSTKAKPDVDQISICSAALRAPIRIVSMHHPYRAYGIS